MTSSQQARIDEELRQEKLRRQQMGELPMTPDEERARRRQMETDVIDTSKGDQERSKIGPTRTDSNGVRIMSGDYKGMTPAEAQWAAQNGGPPGKRPKSGRDEWKALNPNHLLPSEMGRPGPMFPPPSLPGVPAAPASPAPPGLRMPVIPGGAGGTGAAVGSAVGNMAAPPAASPAASAPPLDPARQHQHSVDLANGLNDAKQGVVQRGGGSVTWDNGAAVYDVGNGKKVVSSPYGTGGSITPPPGSAPPTDPRLVAETAAIKARQGKGIYDPQAPMVPAPASSAPSPAPATSPAVATAPGSAAPPVHPNAYRPPAMPAGPGIMGMGPAMVGVAQEVNRRQNDIGNILKSGPPTPGAVTVMDRIRNGQPMLPAAPPPVPPGTNLAGSQIDPLARTANTMLRNNGDGPPSVSRPPMQAPAVNPATTTPRTDTTPMAPADVRKIGSIAGDQGFWYQHVWPAITGQFNPNSKAAPVLGQYGVPVPTSYPDPASRVKGDNQAVLDLEQQGVLKGTRGTDAGGAPTRRIDVVTPQPIIPKSAPGSMQQRVMTPPQGSSLPPPIVQAPSARPPSPPRIPANQQRPPQFVTNR